MKPFHIQASGALPPFASWVLYRYLAPKTWREWAGAGLIQAFIIALYAEMYGFPLTVYLMVRLAPPVHRLVHRALRRGVVHWPTIFSVALFPVIVLVYWLLARSEERRVLEAFGDEYRAYQRRVPMFIPRFGQWGQFVECSSASEQGTLTWILDHMNGRARRHRSRAI